MAFVSNVFATSKGLKVDLTVETNLQSQPARIETYQFGSIIGVNSDYINTGTTNIRLQYPSGLIENGESFQIRVIAQTDNLYADGNGYNSEAKKPEHVSVSLFGNSQQHVGDSQAQSSSNENTNTNSLSQSQATTIYICKDGGCTPQ